MTNRNRLLWPFRPAISIVASLLILFLLILIIIGLRTNLGWFDPEPDSLVLLGIFILSLIPVILVLIDTMIERGGVVEVRGVKIDFSQAQSAAIPDVTIPANIGASSQPVSDSSTTEILDALQKAVGSESIIIDLEDGEAWWETRLLVLLAGAVRHNQPHVVVFVGTKGRKGAYFLGWGYARDLLARLLKAHPQYAVSYYQSLAAARQWELVEPSNVPNSPPPQPTWIQPGVSTKHPWMAFEGNLPNPFFAEQLLASELGIHVEVPDEQPRTINIRRLEDLFMPVLITDHIDETSSSEEQLKTLFKNDSPYVALTQDDRFKSIVPRLPLLNAIIGDLVLNK
jgi:hypothetical protein